MLALPRPVPAQAQEGDGLLPVMHAAPGAPAVDVYANGLLQARSPGGDFSGELVLVDPDNNKAKTVIATDILTAPTSLAISPLGGLYVANTGVISGSGEILRIDRCDSGDSLCREPVALPPPLTAMLSGAAEVNDVGAPERMRRLLHVPAGDPINFGIAAGAVPLAFGLASILGWRAPLRFAPILGLQALYKSFFLPGIIAPSKVKGQVPDYGKPLVLLFVPFIIGDLVALPLPYLFACAAKIP